MDELDMKILDELRSSGLQKADTLASTLGVAKRTVYRRIYQMRMNMGFRIAAIPNPVLLGYKAWAHIGIKVAPGYLDNVARELVRQPLIYGVHICFGTFPIMIHVLFKDFDTLKYFVDSVIRRIEGVHSVEIMPYINPRKYHHFSWPAPVFKETSVGWEPYPDTAHNDYYRIDEIDQKILNTLIHDGITSPIILKSKLGIGEGIIRRRMKKMLDNRLFAIEVMLNPCLVPYDISPITGIAIENRSVHDVIDDFIKNPAVYLASASFGRFDVIIGARFRNMDLLSRFMNYELAKVEGVFSWETFLALKILKYHGIDWSFVTDDLSNELSPGVEGK